MRVEQRGGSESRTAAGPLGGVRVVEFGGLGPVPFAAMLLADLGAHVVRIERPGHGAKGPYEVYNRGRHGFELDLADAGASALAKRLIAGADLLLEGYRPGAMERLGLGPDACLQENPALVYGRVTGWGQDGPWSDRPGHDINYLAIAGALDSFRRVGELPVPPINLVADFAGGALYLVMGLLSALLQARATGAGRVVDAAMVDGVAGLMGSICGRLAEGSWRPEPGTNLLDTGAHFYNVYETEDGGFLAVGAIEPKFYSALLDRLGLDPEALPGQLDREHWPAMTERFAELFARRTRREWEAIFDGSDACVTPVLSLTEAQQHSHLAARGTYREQDGVMQPAPAPRFVDTSDHGPTLEGHAGDRDALRAWGLGDEDIESLHALMH